ncbi:MAG TPA: DUF4010 domain-containing protein [Rhizomicrobium sp.]|nr:DUF4010 domain-containing protein [Rhizomicrobium sp.]
MHEWLTRQDVRDGLLFAAAAGGGADGVSTFSYCAMRVLGPRCGLALSGFAGSFVSSNVVIAAMGARAKGDGRLVRNCAGGSVAAILGSLNFLTALVAAADPEIVRPLIRRFRWSPCRCRAGGGLLAFVLGVDRLVRSCVDLRERDRYRPDRCACRGGVHRHPVASGELDARSGSFAILVGFSANMLAKTVTAFALGGSRDSALVTAGLVTLVLGLWGGYAWNGFG